MFYGLLNLSFWGYVLATFIVTHITIVAVTVYLHRAEAHRSLYIHPILGHFFRFWLWLTTGMETKAWAAIHRKHHAKCETKEDPHSPQVLGLRKVLWEGAELYRKEAKNQETLERYGQGTPEDWIEKNIYTPHSAKGIMLCLLINTVLFGIPGITIWAIQMAWIPLFAAGIINGIGHYWGYRNFECPDAATNIVPWGILIGGEELHNNHHSYPTSAKLSNKWWEFDLGWMYIKIFSWLHLVKVKRVAPTSFSLPGKHTIDGDTLRAIIANRIELMTTYGREVLLPLFNMQVQKLNVDNYKLIKFVLLREESLLSSAEKEQLESFLDRHQIFNKVYQFKRQLQEIWAKTTLSQKELIDALQEWCHSAEATGDKHLQRFVTYLRGYSTNLTLTT